MQVGVVWLQVVRLNRRGTIEKNTRGTVEELSRNCRESREEAVRKDAADRGNVKTHSRVIEPRANRERSKRKSPVELRTNPEGVTIAKR